MDTQKLLLLLSREEGPKLDFKVKLSIDTESSKKELAKDVCALANSRGGRGYILFGIEDKTKKIIGINLEDFSEEQIQQVISSRIDPPVPISVNTIKLKDALIGIITIYDTDQKPYQMRENGAFYTRRGSTTDIMRKDEIASMIQEIGLISYELLPLMRAGVEDLDYNKVSNYFVKSGINVKLDDFILISTGILTKEKDYNELHPSCGGMLLFGKNVNDFMPHAIIRIHNGINPLFPVHYIAGGTLIEMLINACEFIKSCLALKPFPIEVIEDLLAKAVIHRDYFDINNTVEVSILKNRIEILNPGAARRGQNNGKNTYIRRNMWLYLKALTLDSSNNYFHKNINIHLLMSPYGKIKYYNITSKNMFKVVIPINKTQRKSKPSE